MKFKSSIYEFEKIILEIDPMFIDLSFIESHMGRADTTSEAAHYWWKGKGYEISHGSLWQNETIRYTTIYFTESKKDKNIDLEKLKRDFGPAEVRVYSDGKIFFTFFGSNGETIPCEWLKKDNVNCCEEKQNFFITIENGKFGFRKKVLKNSQDIFWCADLSRLPKELIERREKEEIFF